jgi:hypothetical protein
VAFGPFTVKSSPVTDRLSLRIQRRRRRFLRALGPPYRTTYHWKVAERMLEYAWTSTEAEDMAAKAFRIALETDDLLIG